MSQQLDPVATAPKRPPKIAHDLAELGSDFGESFLRIASNESLSDDVLFALIACSSTAPQHHGMKGVVLIAATVFRYLDDSDDELEAFIATIREAVEEAKQDGE